MTELGWNTQDHSARLLQYGHVGRPEAARRHRGPAGRVPRAGLPLSLPPILYVDVALWFGLQDVQPRSTSAGYGLFRANRSAKPSAAAFKALAHGISPQPCGGVIDTTGPEIVIAKPTDGAKFVEMFPLDAKAVEGPGGVGVQKIEIYADGKFSRSDGDGHAQMEFFWPSREWRNGSTHTITFKAWDEADNTTSRTITVTKVQAPAQGAHLGCAGIRAARTRPRSR